MNFSARSANRLVKASIAAGALMAALSAQAITFVGTGWQLDVTIGTSTPPGTWSNAFQDSDTARLGFDTIGSISLWNPSTAPGIGGATPDPAVLTGSYTLQALAGYQLAGLDLTGSGGWLESGSQNSLQRTGAVDLDGNSSTYSFSQTLSGNVNSLLTTLGLPTAGAAGLLGAVGGLWNADAQALSLSGTMHSGTFSFTNNPALIGAMVGTAEFGPEFTVSVSAIPEPHEYALMLAGLGLVSVIARRRKTQV